MKFKIDDRVQYGSLTGRIVEVNLLRRNNNTYGTLWDGRKFPSFDLIEWADINFKKITWLDEPIGEPC